MNTTLYAKKMFVELSKAAKEEKKIRDQKEKERLEYLHIIQQELKVAEKLLDKLSEERHFNAQVLLKLNQKIIDLRERIHELKEKKEGSIKYY